jgi:hypothetical protein
MLSEEAEMIRMLLGSAAAFAVGLAAASLVGPSLVALQGEPMLVAGPAGTATLEPASFQADDCADVRILALTFRSEEDRVLVTLAETRGDKALPDNSYVLAIDRIGRIVASGRPEDLGGTGSAIAAACAPVAAPESAAGSI